VEDAAPRTSERRLRRNLGALRHRNYRLYFIGQVISTVGTWMQSVAMPWLALLLTHDAFHVGLVVATQFTPMLVAGQFGGLLADRFDRRKIMFVADLLRCGFIVSIAFVGTVWWLYAANFLASASAMITSRRSKRRTRARSRSLRTGVRPLVSAECR